MRVVGGIAKGRKLGSPAVPGARPTSELVRGAIFNILGTRLVEGARIADLFAGTGSLGIEGLSRGAVWADFVEHNPLQCAVLRSNLKSTGLSDGGRVYCMRAERALQALTGPYRVVLMDPPYRLETLDPILETLARMSLIEGEGVVVVGHSKRLGLNDRYGTLSKVLSRRYGDSTVDFFSLAGSQ